MAKVKWSLWVPMPWAVKRDRSWQARGPAGDVLEHPQGSNFSSRGAPHSPGLHPAPPDPRITLLPPHQPLTPKAGEKKKGSYQPWEGGPPETQLIALTHSYNRSDIRSSYCLCGRDKTKKMSR